MTVLPLPICKPTCNKWYHSGCPPQDETNLLAKDAALRKWKIIDEPGDPSCREIDKIRQTIDVEQRMEGRIGDNP
jgi:hypothetical protein